MSNLVPFQFDDKEVRTVVGGDEVWFVGSDVAKALGYKDEADAVKLHCKTCKKFSKLRGKSGKTPGLHGDTTMILERDIYRLVMRSRLPSAEKFEEWVVGEVLPSIRKTGKYSVPQTTGDMLVQMATAYAEQEKKLIAIEAHQREMEDRFKRVEAKQTAFEEGHSYFTVLGYCAYKGITIDLTAAKALGKSAAAASKVKDIPVDRVRDARFGMVNAYHESILDELVAESL